MKIWSFAQRVEDLAVKQLVAQLRIEVLDVAVLPRTIGLNIGGPGRLTWGRCRNEYGRALRAK